MKKLAAASVLLLVMGICSVSYGTVLCYNVFGMVRAVDTQVLDGLDRTMLNGFLIMDVNEADGIVSSSGLVIYGRDEQGNRVYREFDDVVAMTLSGNAVAFVIDTGQGNTTILAGNMRERRFGFLVRNNITAPNSLEGSIQLQGGYLLDWNQSLVGSGALTATLNSEQTVNSIRNHKSVIDVLDEIIERLEARGFAVVGGYEEPPQPM